MVTTPTGLPWQWCIAATAHRISTAGSASFPNLPKLPDFPLTAASCIPLFFRKALEGDADAGGLLSYNYFSGEGVTAVNEGRPLFVRTPESAFTLANFCRMHLLSALSTLRIGLDILRREENVHVERICAHGGFFKTPGVGQRILAAAVGAPVSVMETAGEGGPYGMALLCAYMLWRRKGESLEEYLDNRVFADAGVSTVLPDSVDAAGFTSFLERYKAAFPLERLAVETLKMEKTHDLIGCAAIWRIMPLRQRSHDGDAFGTCRARRTFALEDVLHENGIGGKRCTLLRRADLCSNSGTPSVCGAGDHPPFQRPSRRRKKPWHARLPSCTEIPRC